MEWEIFSHIYHWSQTSRSRSRNVLTRFLSIRINWLKYLKPDMTSLQQLWQLISLYMTLYYVIVYIIISLSDFELWDPYFKKIIQPSKKTKNKSIHSRHQICTKLKWKLWKMCKIFFSCLFRKLKNISEDIEFALQQVTKVFSQNSKKGNEKH